MAPKRKANDSGIPAEKPNRRPEDTIGEESIRNDGDNMNGITCVCRCIVNYSQLPTVLKDMIQQAVQAGIAAALHQSPRLTPNLCGGMISETKQFQLQFNSKLKGEYFTETKIVAERDEPIQIVLRDVESRTTVTEGPMSSLEIEICVLQGDFGSGYGHQNWSRAEFNAKIIVRPREGRKALLKCDTSRITLKDGVASIPKIEFTDISRWASGTGKFILAARSEEANVREAISQPFIVKDKRGKPNGKLKKPLLDSDMWRLRHIAKDKEIHKQMSADGITTVKDFLRLHTMNPSSLRKKFGNIADKKWDDIVDNARACVIGDNEHYVYVCQATEGQLTLIFNPIYEVVKVSFDGQTYRSPETFIPAEKPLVEVAKKEAYENEKDFRPWQLDSELSLGTVGRTAYSVDSTADFQNIGIINPSLLTTQHQEVGQSRVCILDPPQQVNLSAVARQGQVTEWGPSPGRELALGLSPDNEQSMHPDNNELCGHSIPDLMNLIDWDAVNKHFDIS